MNEIAFLIKEFCDTEENCEFFDNYTGIFNIIEPCIALAVCDDINNIGNILIRLCDFLHKAGIDNVMSMSEGVLLNTFKSGIILYFPNIAGNLQS